MLLTWFDPHLPLLALSRSPGSRALTLSQDLETIEEAGIQHIICLQETFELEMLGESIEQRLESVFVSKVAKMGRDGTFGKIKSRALGSLDSSVHGTSGNDIVVLL